MAGGGSGSGGKGAAAVVGVNEGEVSVAGAVGLEYGVLGLKMVAHSVCLRAIARTRSILELR